MFKNDLPYRCVASVYPKVPPASINPTPKRRGTVDLAISMARNKAVYERYNKSEAIVDGKVQRFELA